MHDLNQQLDDYLNHVIERFDVESLPEILHDTSHGDQAVIASTTPTPPPRNRGWFIAAAAAHPHSCQFVFIGLAVCRQLGSSTLA